jgi:hypothetical protein
MLKDFGLNLVTGDILINSLLAHGRNTGEEFACFPNVSDLIK